MDIKEDTSITRYLRLLTGLNQTELAEKIGTDKGNVVTVERGDGALSNKSLPKYAKFFGIEQYEMLKLVHMYPTREKTNELMKEVLKYVLDKKK